MKKNVLVLTGSPRKGGNSDLMADAFIIGEKPLKIKESLLLVCGEINDENVFDGIIKSYELIVFDRKWINRGELIVPNVNNKGDIYNTDALEKAERFGRNI